MHTPAELEAKFWKALKSDMTIMLGLDGDEDAHPRPMTAQLENDKGGPIWFFTSTESELVEEVGNGSDAIATFVSKGHDLFATVHGKLYLDNNRAAIDRLWNRSVAAWFDKGKEDPKLTLLRFEPDHAEIWLDASSIVAGIKMLLGADPKKAHKDHVAKVSL